MKDAKAAAAAAKEDKALAAASKDAVARLLQLKEQLAKAEERWVAREEGNVGLDRGKRGK